MHYLNDFSSYVEGQAVKLFAEDDELLVIQRMLEITFRGEKACFIINVFHEYK